MPGARLSRSTLKRSHSDTNVSRTFADIDPAVWTLGETYFANILSSSHESTESLDDSVSDTSNISPGSPPLPPRPPRDSLDHEAPPINNRWPKPHKLISLRKIWSMRRSKGKAETIVRRAEEETHRARGTGTAVDTSEEVIRDTRPMEQLMEHKFDAQFLMSGALPNDSNETLSARSIALSDNTRRLPSAVGIAFDMVMKADALRESLHSTTVETPPDVFSQQGRYELSRCSSPSEWQYEPVSHLSGHRRDPFTIDAVMSPQTDMPSDIDEETKLFKPDSAGGTVATLPTELLQEVYWHLGPTDFNAARHTCHNWIAASLLLQLLIEQLKRGGWWLTASKCPSLFQERRHCWPMSCYLARECALAGKRTGQGLRADSANVVNPAVLSCSVDFTAVQEITDPNDDLGRRAVVCTTSPCGTYFLTAAGPNIFTYEIEGRSIRLISRTSCGRQVVAVSIDSSSERFAIAALLEGRIGLYIDIFGKPRPSSVESPWESAGSIVNTAPDAAPIMDLATGDGTGARDVFWDVPVGHFDELSLNAASTGSRPILHQSVEILTQHIWSEFFRGRRARLRGMRQMPALSNGFWPGTLTFEDMSRGIKGKSGEVESRSQIVYRNICTEENPPCSVAMSPTRQCVAFGCSSGVELYWIDPTTGQPLNRRFPLAKPADHLYFVPPRRGIDSPLRLRLISSEIHTRPADGFTDPDTAMSPQSFWFILTGPWRFPLTRAARQQTPNSDHCYAVPLSDGHHILFTDNETGLLCLGSDRPTGNSQRLSRKFVFEPPASLSINGEIAIPTGCAASNDASSGVRIAAGYGNDVVLYSVPVDALRYSTAEQEQILIDSSDSFEELEHVDLLLHPASNAQVVRDSEIGDEESPAHFERLNMLWAHYLPAAGDHRAESINEIWPLRIPGTCVGSLEYLAALSVQETIKDGLTVWAFNELGMARTWRVDDGERPISFVKRAVGFDGNVRDVDNPLETALEPFVS